jgi:hypothetical protein
MSDAALTPRHRLRLARLIVEIGWTVGYAAAAFRVSWPTAARWARRYCDAGQAGVGDRSSRPLRNSRRTPRPVVRQTMPSRWKQRLGATGIAARVGVAPSTADLNRPGIDGGFQPPKDGSHGGTEEVPPTSCVSERSPSPSTWSTVRRG